MGGIPTNRFGQVVAPYKEGAEEPIPGLYAVGECACVSVHGANRLGGNSLLDIVVFGRAAGNHIIETQQGLRYRRPLAAEGVEQALERLARWDRPGEGESADNLRTELQKTMEQNCGVFRNEAVLKGAAKHLDEIVERLSDVRLKDQSRIFNTARLDALELENLVDLAQAVVHCALERQESRGAHYRVDYPERDDVRWLKHSLYFRGQKPIEYKPVRLKPLTVETFPPKERVY